MFPANRNEDLVIYALAMTATLSTPVIPCVPDVSDGYVDVQSIKNHKLNVRPGNLVLEERQEVAAMTILVALDISSAVVF